MVYNLRPRPNLPLNTPKKLQRKINKKTKKSTSVQISKHQRCQNRLEGLVPVKVLSDGNCMFASIARIMEQKTNRCHTQQDIRSSIAHRKIIYIILTGRNNGKIRKGPRR